MIYGSIPVVNGRNYLPSTELWYLSSGPASCRSCDQGGLMRNLVCHPMNALTYPQWCMYANNCSSSNTNCQVRFAVAADIAVAVAAAAASAIIVTGCETWTLTLREEQRLRVFESKVLRKIFGAKRDEVTVEWRKLHNVELHALGSSSTNSYHSGYDVVYYTKGPGIESRRIRKEGFSRDSQITSLVQDLAEGVDRGGRIDAVVIDFSKAFDLVPHDILIDKLSRLGIDKRVVLWIQEFLKGRTQRVRVGHEISEIGNISSGVPQGSVLGPLLFIIYVNDLCQNITSNVRLFADDCIIYRKIRNNSDVDAIQTDLNKIYNWALMHKMKINGSKSKSITFCKTRGETSLNYEFSGVVIPQVQCCKYLGVYLNSKLSWGEHVDNVTGKAWRALHFIMKILRKASPKSREIAYLTLMRPLMEYGTTCWDPYRIYQINSLERIQYRAAKFVKGKREDGNDTIKELKWETLENRRRKTRITALYRAHLGQKAWVDITARLEKPTYYGRNDHDFKIKCRKQKTDVGKFSFLNRTINDWNDLPASVFEGCPSLRSFKNNLKSCVSSAN
ncbi:hypothetical protein ANN_22265 [Periplaneta americana]|uniref:Reverse transcriptase domain-containing protein n=1 Tax=Periplaneta americana TaxID=6978 RepID=A0ABQ8S8L5_PERAM|nr:hypothetical protein ANN_22265 [Periplaneta americana]